MPRSGSIRKDLLASSSFPARVPQGHILKTCDQIKRSARRKCGATPILCLAPSSLRPLIRDLHAEHVSLGGTRQLPDLEIMTKRHLRLLAIELTRGNAGLKGGSQ